MQRSSESRQPVALVTGGSRGIGQAIVRSLLEERWRVFFCSRTENSLQAALDSLAKTHLEGAAARVCDVGDQAQVEELVQWVQEEAGRIDCLINNAGIGLFAPLDEISGEDWRRLIRTNLDGPFYAMRAVAPVMKRQKDGWIINIASLAGRHAFTGGAAYNASKFGLMGLTEAGMLDLRRHGIRIAAILPGSVNTEFGHSRAGAVEDWKLAPEDVARAVVDLLRYPDRALPSVVELRPSRPPAK